MTSSTQKMTRTITRTLALGAVALAAACADQGMPTQPVGIPAADPLFAIESTSSPTNGMTNPNSGNAATSFTINKPAGVAVGDFLLAQITFEKGSDAGSNEQITPSGWTLVHRVNSGSDLGQAIFYRFATATDASAATTHYTFGTFSQAVKAAGGIIRYTGVYGASPIVAFSDSSGASGNLAVRGIDAEANSMVVAFFGLKKQDASMTTPAGMTERYLFQNPQDVRIKAADEIRTTAGATGNKTSVASPSDKWVAHLVALRAASRIIVTKETLPEGSDEEFDFTLSGGPAPGVNQEFSLGDGDEYDTGFTLRAGTYSVVEDTPTGWDLTSAVCLKGETQINPAAIQLGAGETVSCTFTNTQRGEIIVQKVTDPEDSDQEFDFTLTGGPDELDEDFKLAGGGEYKSGLIKPGSYSVVETELSGWDLTSAVCDNDDDPSVITLGAGETVTCTFTNSEEATSSPPSETALFLHNFPTPPTGNTNAQANLPLNLDAPTATTLYNYARNLDSNAGVTGRFMDKISSSDALSTTDLQKYQTWRTAALASNLVISGDVQLRIWAKMKASGKNIQLRAYLRDCNSSLSSCTNFATLTMPTVTNASRTAFQELTLSASGVNRTLAAGRVLQLRVVMIDISNADPAYLAYDTQSFPARLILP